MKGNCFLKNLFKRPPRRRRRSFWHRLVTSVMAAVGCFDTEGRHGISMGKEQQHKKYNKKKKASTLFSLFLSLGSVYKERTLTFFFKKKSVFAYCFCFWPWGDGFSFSFSPLFNAITESRCRLNRLKTCFFFMYRGRQALCIYFIRNISIRIEM